MKRKENVFQLFNILKQHAPKTYDALMKRKAIFEKYFAKLDATAQQFVRNVSKFHSSHRISIHNSVRKRPSREHQRPFQRRERVQEPLRPHRDAWKEHQEGWSPHLVLPCKDSY